MADTEPRPQSNGSPTATSETPASLASGPASTASSGSRGLSDGSWSWLDEHLESIRKEIIQEAKTLAEEDSSSEVLPKHVAQAAMRFAPGERFPAEMGFWARIFASISGITIISAILAICFGVLTAIGKGDYLDVVKIFAGAVVGSTGASVALAAKRR
jgi:hypothetical protein